MSYPIPTNLESDFEKYECKDPLSYICLKRPLFSTTQGPSNFYKSPIFEIGIKQLPDFNTSPNITNITSSNNINITSSNTYNGRSNLSNTNKSNVTISNLMTIGDILYTYNTLAEVRDVVFKYVYITDGEGDWIRFIQRKFVQSFGYGLNINSSKWNFNNLVTTLSFLNVVNNIENFRDFIELVLEDVGDNIDLVMIDTNNTMEYYTLVQVFIAFSTMKNISYVVGANMILRLNNIYSKKMDQLIYLIANSFEWITMFKPLVSNDRFLVCYNYKKDPLILSVIEDHIITNNTGLFFNQIPDGRFNAWLEQMYLKMTNIVDTNNYDIPLLDAILKFEY